MRLEAKNLSFSYDVKGRQILRQFSLSADSSERVGIIAPSGFGKTTLCKILSGYEAPQSGEVLLDGKPLSEYGAYCPVQMIWQHPEQAVNPRLRMKNVIEEGDRTAPELIEKLGIEPDWMNRFPTELSGGELQRFCIARALAVQPEVLLMDEPTSNLDSLNEGIILKSLREEGKMRTVLLVSHRKATMKVADVVFHMDPSVRKTRT